MNGWSVALGLMAALAAAAPLVWAQPAKPPLFSKPVAPVKPTVAMVRTPEQPTARRLKGWPASGASGAAQCRTLCSRGQYDCLAKDAADCSVIWSRCAAACPQASAMAR